MDNTGTYERKRSGRRVPEMGLADREKVKDLPGMIGMLRSSRFTAGQCSSCPAHLIIHGNPQCGQQKGIKDSGQKLFQMVHFLLEQKHVISPNNQCENSFSDFCFERT